MVVNDHFQFTYWFNVVVHALVGLMIILSFLTFCSFRSRKVMKPDRSFQMQNQFHPRNFLGIRLNQGIGRPRSRCRSTLYVLLLIDIFVRNKLICMLIHLWGMFLMPRFCFYPVFALGYYKELYKSHSPPPRQKKRRRSYLDI